VIRYVCNFSGGITSWAAAKRIVEQEGREGVVLLFADTLIEDEDCYRFLDDAAANVGLPLTRIADGRDPWQVFRDERFIGNSRVDPCSKILKRELLDRWHREHASDATTVVGLAWDEPERIARLAARMAPRKVRAPLAERPCISKFMALSWARQEGLRPPRMYEMGFPHANCGGFCVKAGHGTFALLLRHFRDRYLEHERQEAAMREHLGQDVAILTDRTGGDRKPLTMQAFRERVEAGACQVDMFDHGGCGCAVDDSGEAA
jgi:hypothetical protein